MNSEIILKLEILFFFHILKIMQAQSSLNFLPNRPSDFDDMITLQFTFWNELTIHKLG